MTPAVPLGRSLAEGNRLRKRAALRDIQKHMMDAESAINAAILIAEYDPAIDDIAPALRRLRGTLRRALGEESS